MSTITGQITQIEERNRKEIELGFVGTASSWHEEFKESAYVHISGLPYELNEGDILQIFSEFGEPIDLDLRRDEKTGKSLGFCFLCYEDSRSAVLAVDNLNGSEVLDRRIKVNHTRNYFKRLKEGKKKVDVPILLKKLYPASTLGLKEESTPSEHHRHHKHRNHERRKKKEKRRKKHKKESREKKKEEEDFIFSQTLNEEQLKKKRERMRMNREKDYERRKLKYDREKQKDVAENDSYHMAYNYGTKMNLDQSRFDMTDLKVYQYEKYQKESEKYKREKEEREMKKKNEYLDRKEARMRRGNHQFSDTHDGPRGRERIAGRKRKYDEIPRRLSQRGRSYEQQRERGRRNYEDEPPSKRRRI